MNKIIKILEIDEQINQIRINNKLPRIVYLYEFYGSFDNNSLNNKIKNNRR